MGSGTCDCLFQEFKSCRWCGGAAVDPIRQVPLAVGATRGVGFFTARLGGATARAQTQQHVAPTTGLLVHIGDGLRSP